MTTTLMSNEQLIEMFKDSLVLQDLSERTVYANCSYVKTFADAIDKPLPEVTKTVIQAYLRNMTCQNGKKMNVSTKLTHQSAIRNFYNFLYSSDEPEIMDCLKYIDQFGHVANRRNPVENLESVMASKNAKLERNPRKEGLTEEEARKYLHTIYDLAKSEENEVKRVLRHRDYALVLLILELGLRSSDVIALNKSNFKFSLDKRTLTYGVQKTKELKTSIVSEILADALMEYWDMRNDESDIAFSSVSGKRLTNNAMNKILEDYAEEARLKKSVTCHILRHTCGALVYINSNGDIMVTKEVMGHKSISVTQIYAMNQQITDKAGEKTSSVTNKLVANW